MTSVKRLIAAAAAAFLMTPAVAGESEPIRVYLDADQTNAVNAGEAIEAGIAAAIKLAGGSIEGRPLELVSLNHRGNIKRSKRNFNTFAEDLLGLAIFTGLHSPPVLRYRDWINESSLLTLDPWAAAGPITRPSEGTNWIFRLSVDDANAGVFIANAVADEGVRRPFLFLENTGWGKNNERTIADTLAARLGGKPPIQWFDWGVSQDAMRVMVGEALSTGADAIVFVGNTPEGTSLIRVLAELPDHRRPTLYSHWGITGGSLLEEVPAEEMRKVDVRFIQTDFEIQPEDEQALVWEAFAAAQQLGYFESVESPRQIAAPTGFVHAFDLTNVFLAAVEQAGLTGDIAVDRMAVREALESLEQPVAGIIKTYERPFRAYDEPGSDAHEALGLGDYVISHYADDGTIERIEPTAVADASRED